MAALAMDVRTALGRLRVRAHRNHGQKLYDGLSLTGEPVILPPAFAQPRPRAKPGNQPPTLRRLTDTVRGVIAHVGAVNQLSFGALRKGLGAAMGSHLEGSLPFVARHAPTNVPLKQARDFATASLPLGKCTVSATSSGPRSTTSRPRLSTTDCWVAERPLAVQRGLDFLSEGNRRALGLTRCADVGIDEDDD